MKKRWHDVMTGYTIGIVILLLIGLLLLVLFSAEAYRGTIESQQERDNQRMLLSYLSTGVRNHDHSGGITVESGEQGDVLIFTEALEGSNFVTSIYWDDGVLVEEFAREETPRGQGTIQRIGSCETFRVLPVSGGYLRITVDSYELLLYLRSGSGGAA